MIILKGIKFYKILILYIKVLKSLKFDLVNAAETCPCFLVTRVVELDSCLVILLCDLPCSDSAPWQALNQFYWSGSRNVDSLD